MFTCRGIHPGGHPPGAVHAAVSLLCTLYVALVNSLFFHIFVYWQQAIHRPVAIPNWPTQRAALMTRLHLMQGEALGLAYHSYTASLPTFLAPVLLCPQHIFHTTSAFV